MTCYCLTLGSGGTPIVLLIWCTSSSSSLSDGVTSDDTTMGTGLAPVYAVAIHAELESIVSIVTVGVVCALHQMVFLLIVELTNYVIIVLNVRSVSGVDGIKVWFMDPIVGLLSGGDLSLLLPF